MTEKIVAAKKTASPRAKKEPATSTVTTKKAAVVAVSGKPKVVTAAQGQAKKVTKPNKSPGKIKVVRDSFNMPQTDYAKLGELKQLCLKAGVKVKKSQLLRAGLHVLEKLSMAQLKIALVNLDKAPQADKGPGK